MTSWPPGSTPLPGLLWLPWLFVYTLSAPLPCKKLTMSSCTVCQWPRSPVYVTVPMKLPVCTRRPGPGATGRRHSR